jgi:hypothetical protein
MSMAETMTKTYEGKSGEARFRSDAPVWATHGYGVVSTTRTGGGRSAAGTLWIVVALVLLAAGLLFWPAWVAAVIALVIGLTAHGAARLTVTYRKD